MQGIRVRNNEIVYSPKQTIEFFAEPKAGRRLSWYVTKKKLLGKYLPKEFTRIPLGTYMWLMNNKINVKLKEKQGF